jgi:Ca2+-dependent lipid-binding protein
MFLSFLLGYFNLKFFMLIALGGYVGAYVQLGRNPEAEKADSEKEKELWATHYKMYPQVETCDWLNQSMTQFWIKNGTAIGEMICQNVNPVLEQNKPSFLKSITLDKVNFGQNAPKLDSIRVDTKSADAFVMDYYVSFYSDMSYEMSVKSGLLSAPTIVEKIVFFAKMRITIDYMDPIPFLARISTSVMERPKIDFVVRPLKGLDLTAFPGLSPWLNQLINDLVIDGMLLYPNKFVVELSKAAVKKADEITDGTTATTVTAQAAGAPPPV